jgi:DNA-binding transcriptional LysR family regulator
MAQTIHLRQLECFLAVAEELHFGRAAERLRLSPSSVSEAVSALERRLGGRLFERTSRTVRLTEQGATFLREVREPFERIVRAHQTVRADLRRRREVVIAHTPELGHLVLPLLLSTPVRDDPVDGELRWRPVLRHTTDQLREVEDGTVDIGLCWSVLVDPPLRAIDLAEVPMVAVLRADVPLAAADTVSLPALRTRQLLVTPRKDNPYNDSRLQAAFLEAGVPLGNVEEIDRYDELTVHVASGARVGIHPGTIAAVNRIGTVVFRPLVDPATSVTIRALTRCEHDAATQALLDTLITVVDALDLLKPVSSETSTR